VWRQGAIIFTASHFGIPHSTTHIISTSIMGVGAMKRFSAVKWGLVHSIVWAWVLAIPVAGVWDWTRADMRGVGSRSRRGVNVACRNRVAPRLRVECGDLSPLWVGAERRWGHAGGYR
jgi:hypothetical protein